MKSRFSFLFFIYRWNSLKEIGAHYARFLRFLGIRKTLIVHGLGLGAALLNMIGFASFFPIFAILFEGETAFMNKYVVPLFQGRPLPLILVQHPFAIALTVVLSIYIIKTIVLVLFGGLGGGWVEKFVASVRRDILVHFEKGVGNKIEREEKSRLLFFNSQLAQLNSYTWAVLDANLKFYILFFLSFLLLFLSAGLILIAGAAAVIVGLFLLPFFKWTRRSAARYFVSVENAMKEFRHQIEGIETIKTLGVFPERISILSGINKKLVSDSFRLSLSKQFVMTLPEFCLILIGLTLIVVVRKFQIELALLSTYGYAFSRFINTLNDFNSRLNSVLEMKKVPDGIFQFLGKDNFSKHYPPISKKITDLPLHIRFDQVSVPFSSGFLISKISFEINGSGLIQFIGPNGSGKSTILKCLMRLIPYDGDIWVNDVNLKSISETDLYQKFAYHSQENFLLDGTIMENLRLGSSSMSTSEVKKRCRDLGFDLEKIFDLGYEHPVSEDGKNLSGGEKQLVCLLRTLIRDSKCLLMDEATNHLSQSVIEKLLNQLKILGSQKTILIVSHQATQSAQRRIYLTDGLITHMENSEQ